MTKKAIQVSLVSAIIRAGMNMIYTPKHVMAATAPSLGMAESFAVLGGSTVTNTVSSVINGDLGLSPGKSVTGFPPGIVNGAMHVTDAVALQAQANMLIAYNNLKDQPSEFDLTGQDMGGLTLTAGVYSFFDVSPVDWNTHS